MSPRSSRAQPHPHRPQARKSVPSGEIDGSDLDGLLRLYVSGMSEDELAHTLGLRPKRVRRLLQTALEEHKASCLDRVAAARERELATLQFAIREAVLILVERCQACGGDHEARVSCDACSHSGYLHIVEKRLAALSTITRLSARRIKLLQLDKQPPRSR